MREPHDCVDRSIIIRPAEKIIKLGDEALRIGTDNHPARGTVNGKMILFDDQPRQKTALFVGICQDDHPEKPFLALTVHATRRFKSRQGAAR